MTYLTDMQIKACEYCHTLFAARNKTSKFCSEKCQYTTLNNKITRECARFGICKLCNQSRYVRKKDGLCKSCVHRGIAPNDFRRNCISCGKEFVVSIEAPQSNIYCSKECRLRGKCCQCGHHPTQLTNGKCFWCNHNLIRVYNTSKGELLLRKRVDELYKGHNIQYNYRPQWLKRSGIKFPMEIDVAVINLKVGFEYDGRFHHDHTFLGYEKIKIRDNEKTRICYDNGWILFRINGTNIISNSIKFEAALREFDDE
jgi:hypothetical protein